MKHGFLAMVGGMLLAAQAIGQTPVTLTGADEPVKLPALETQSASHLFDGDCHDPWGRAWLSADYLRWWVRSGPITTPLLTLGTLGDAPPAALGQPGTQVLFGDHPLHFDSFNGMRLQGGYSLNC